MRLNSGDGPGVFGRVRGVAEKRAGDNRLWVYDVGDERVFVASPALSERLGRTPADLERSPLILHIRDADGFSVGTDVRFPGDAHRRSRVCDMSSRDFIFGLGASDVFDAALGAYCDLQESDIPRGKTFKRAEEAFGRWLEKSHLFSEPEWLTGLIESLRTIRDTAEDGLRGDHRGAFSTRKACNTALSALHASVQSQKVPKAVLLGSQAVSQFHDFGPDFPIKSGFYVARSVMACMERWLEKAYDFDKEVVEAAVRRAESAATISDKRRELALAITWSWYAIRRRQQLKGLGRHEGPLGLVVQNLEIAVQWVGGAIPDKGPFKGVDLVAAPSPEQNIILASAFQNARKSPGVTKLSDQGEIVLSCSGGERIVSGGQAGTRVVDADGNVLFHRPLPPSTSAKIKKMLSPFGIRRNDREGSAPAPGA